MITLSHYNKKHVAVFGLGGSGLSTALALQAGGAKVYAFDDNEASCEKARAVGIHVQDLRTINWAKIECLVLSPGVPLTHPTPHWSVDLATTNKKPIIGDLELFYHAVKKYAKIIAITGTNGKSTTTALLGHMLHELGQNCQVGGNIGKAVLTLEPPRENEIYVVECSSFQIDLAPSLEADIAILTNITPDHIDRHGSIQNYANIKARLVEKARCAIVGVEDPYSKLIHKGLSKALQVKVQAFSHEDISLRGSKITINGFDKFELAGIDALRGKHNAQNAACAIAALLGFNFNAKAMQTALSSFGGLAHRMEQVGQQGDILFINDSKATNADSTQKALLSFDNIYWIAGGKSKEGGIEPLRDYFPAITKTYLIGASSEDFANSLQGFNFENCDTMEVALKQAYADAKKAGKGVILLSPACASYDQFQNFEVRGNMFRDMVKNIIK